MLVKVARGGRPFVLEKCIEEIEQRGLRVEGIYRVSGSKELIERLKALFEKGIAQFFAELLLSVYE